MLSLPSQETMCMILLAFYLGVLLTTCIVHHSRTSSNAVTSENDDP